GRMTTRSSSPAACAPRSTRPRGRRAEPYPPRAEVGFTRLRHSLSRRKSETSDFRWGGSTTRDSVAAGWGSALFGDARAQQQAPPPRPRRRRRGRPSPQGGGCKVTRMADPSPDNPYTRGIADFVAGPAYERIPAAVIA